MKLVKILLTPPVLAISVAFCGAANAADRFVSTSGEWKLSDDGVCYTDLQTAVDEAKTGETVWLQDGFVCETGKGKESISNQGFPRVDIPNKVITVRSESGEVDEAAGKGATIRGAKDPASTKDDGRGVNAIRPLRVRNSNTVIMGLVLENGSTGDSANYGVGGAIYGACIVSNCVLRNNFAYCGGAIGDRSYLYNCVFTNNTGFGTGYGGGAVYGFANLYNCLLVDNYSAKGSGAAVYTRTTDTTKVAVYSNCVFRANRGGTTVTYEQSGPRGIFYDCEFSDCAKGGLNGTFFELYNCRLINNTSRVVHGGNSWTASAPLLVDCVISNNTAGTDGGAVFGCTVRDSFFTNNWVTGSYNGGAAAQCVLDGCTIIDCRSSNNGGAVTASSLTNCFIANCTALYGGGVSGNSTLYGTVISNCYASGTGYGGGAIFESEGSKFAAYDSVFVGNSAIKSGGAIYGINKGTGFSGTFSNCQFIVNSDPSTAGAVYYNQNGANAVRVTFTDCVFRDNLSTAGGVAAIRGVVGMKNCLLAGNISRNGGTGAVNSGATVGDVDRYAILEGCVISNNVTEGTGGGVTMSVLRDCKIVGNVAEGNGGGAFQCYLSGCEVVGNVSSNVINKASTTVGGGGLYQCSATNCLIAGNAAFSTWMNNAGNGAGGAFVNLYNCTVTNNHSGYRGAAVYNAMSAYVCYNCLFADNYSEAPHIGYDRGMIIEGESGNTMPAPEKTPQFYNCTIAGNVAEHYNIVNAAALHNCIVWGNTTPNAELFPGQVTADYTCQKDLTPGTDEKNLNCNPRLTVDYRPGYPVKNKGLYYPWMDDENDVRSKDLAGGPRILGAAPDLGCYEPPIPGLMLLVK